MFLSRIVRKKKLICGGCRNPLVLSNAYNVSDSCGMVYAEREVLRCDTLDCTHIPYVVGETEIRSELTWFGRLMEVLGVRVQEA